jgi:mannonate dehydratase
VGTIAEMRDGDVYEAVDRYSAQQRIAYIHMRNVRGKVPEYKETHIDEGDVDVLSLFRILKKNHFAGMVIPDHAPQLTCDAPWHSGMAFAMGYLRACLKAVEV